MKLPVLAFAFVLLLLEHISISPTEASQFLERKKTVWKSASPQRRNKRSFVGDEYEGVRRKRWNDEEDESNYSSRSKEGGRGEYALNQILSNEERAKLEAVYGANVVRQHYRDFQKARELSQYGAHEHKVPWRMMPDNQPVVELDKEFRNNAKLNAINSEPIIQPKTIVVDAEDSSSDDKKPLIAGYLHHCNIHGLWMSSVAGVAIELLPIVQENGRIEIRTKIFNLPDTSRKGILTSQWTGSGMISPESPTTMTIVFQEHISGSYNNAPVSETNEAGKQLPKTAIFVGQCLVCESSPILQGTWTVFPNTQSCARGLNATKSLENGKEKVNKLEETQETLYLFKKSM